ncbi:thioredoxin-like domain-containing protein [Aggregatilineales bacterium SYSU G02658]
MKNRYFIRWLITLMACGWLGMAAQAQDERFIGRAPAPDFPTGLDWLNVPAPLTLSDLQGKIVILDFWTYGCINCIHMIPVLAQVGERFRDEVVIISVHSAKFTNEGDTANLRQIVQRYGIHHPVVNDRDFLIWRSYGIRAWPSFVVIDPDGNVVTRDAGEISFDVFETYLSAMIAFYDQMGRGKLDRTPLELALEGASAPSTPLRFPGKVLADPRGNRLFISDTNHHRVIVADLTTYEVLDVIGGGRGRADGTFDEARFNQPQGLALQGERLYIADTNNHQIRMADLTTRTVTTLAGSGSMSPTLAIYGQEVGDLTLRPLRSPWGLAFGSSPDDLYIGMAGMHQIHRLDLRTMRQAAVVGSGYEGQLNGTPGESELAQPSGLFFVNGDLFFADSESSTIRAVNFALNQVRVVSGTTENNLFDYGDVDGPPGVSRLQHALDVTGTPDGRLLFIADTYNHRIKQIDTSTDVTTTLFGVGAGFRDGGAEVAQFHEPGGISYANGRLYVADTNNHAVRVIDLERMDVSTVTFPNVERLLTDAPVVVVGGNQAQGAVRLLDVHNAPIGPTTLTLALTLPSGYKLNPLAPSSVTLASSNPQIAQAAPEHTVNALTVDVPLELLAAGDADLTLALTLFYCEETQEQLCLIDMTTLVLPLRVQAGAPSADLTVRHDVTLPAAYDDPLQ